MQIDGTLSTIEFQREALENSSTNTEVLRVMGDAAKALKTAHKNMSVSHIFYTFCTFDIHYINAHARR